MPLGTTAETAAVTRTHWTATLAVALLLAGCATPIVYGPISETSAFGYRDTRNADGSYTVLVVAASAAMAHEFWDRRAHELCGEDFTKNIFRAQIPVYSYTGYASNGYSGGAYTEDRYGAFNLEGYLHCGAGEASPEATTAPTP